MLKNKTAIVTGAGRGIGRAVALKMASYGAQVVIADMDVSGAESVAEEIKALGGNAIALKVNVVSKEDCAAVVEKTIEQFGKLDILAHCAGINIACKMIDMTDDIWDKINNHVFQGTSQSASSA